MNSMNRRLSRESRSPTAAVNEVTKYDQMDEYAVSIKVQTSSDLATKTTDRRGYRDTTTKEGPNIEGEDESNERQNEKVIITPIDRLKTSPEVQQELEQLKNEYRKCSTAEKKEIEKLKNYMSPAERKELKQLMNDFVEGLKTTMMEGQGIAMKDKPWRNPFADYTKQQWTRPDDEEKQSEATEASRASNERQNEKVIKDKPWRNPFADYTKQQWAMPADEEKKQSEATEASQAIEEKRIQRKDMNKDIKEQAAASGPLQWVPDFFGPLECKAAEATLKLEEELLQREVLKATTKEGLDIEYEVSRQQPLGQERQLIQPLAQERQQQKVIEYEEPEAEFESPIDMKDKPWRNPFADYTKQQGARPDGEDKMQSEADEVSQALEEKRLQRKAWKKARKEQAAADKYERLQREAFEAEQERMQCEAAEAALKFEEERLQREVLKSTKKQGLDIEYEVIEYEVKKKKKKKKMMFGAIFNGFLIFRALFNGFLIFSGLLNGFKNCNYLRVQPHNWTTSALCAGCEKNKGSTPTTGPSSHRVQGAKRTKESDSGLMANTRHGTRAAQAQHGTGKDAAQAPGWRVTDERTASQHNDDPT
jgi:hypothetical protein